MKTLMFSSMSKTIKDIPALEIIKGLKKFDVKIDDLVINKAKILVDFLKADISFGLGIKCWHMLAITGGILLIKIIIEDEDNKTIQELKKKLNNYIKENPTKTKFISLGIVIGTSLILFL